MVELNTKIYCLTKKALYFRPAFGFVIMNTSVPLQLVKLRKCFKCDKAFTDKKAYTMHLRTHLEKRKECSECGKKFKDQWSLQNHHVRLHTSEKNHKCDICEKTFKLIIDLKLHRKKHDPRFKCDKCNVLFHYASQVKRHNEMVHCNGNYPCDVCGKSYKNQKYLIYHMKSHEEDYNSESVRCQFCNNMFSSRQTLYVHTKIQHKGDTHVCDICGKSVTSLRSLTSHMTTHNDDDEKQIFCEMCGKSFTSNKYLKIHLLVHTKEKPHKCHFCDKCFSQRSSLTIHIRGVHKKEKPYECDICQKKFVTKTIMKTHLKTHGTPI